MRKRIRSIFLLICLLFLLAGCEFKDIDKRFFVVSIGVDKPEHSKKKYKVTLKLAIPSGSIRMGSESFQNFSEESDSITEAVQLIKARMDKEADFGHAKALLIGQAIAAEDYRDPLNWFIRQRYIQKIAFMGIGKPDATSVLAVKPKYERLPSNALFLAFGRIGVESQYIVTQDLFHVYRDSKSKEVTPVMPVIEARGDHFKIDHLSVLNDRKTVLTLSPDETKLINILRERFNKTDFDTFTLNNQFLVHTEEIKVNEKSHFDEAKPNIEIDLRMQGIVEERVKKMQITESVLNAVDKSLEQEISQESVNLLKKFQQHQVDPLGLGMVYAATHWDSKETEEKNWAALYPKLTFRVHTDVNLRSPGEIE